MGRLLVIASIAAELRLGGVLPTITYGVAYSATLHQVGGTGIASLACASALPTGITFTDNGDGTGTLAGTTTSPGDFPITVTGLDADRTPLLATYVLHVQVLPIAISGDAGDQRIGDSDTFSGYAASGGSGTGYIWAVVSGALPPGWGPINSSNGHIPRTPTTTGDYSCGVQVTDSLGNVSGIYADSATIRYPVITLTGSFASLGVIGVPYSSDITITGGDGTYSNQRFTSGAVSGMGLSIVTVVGVKKLRLSGTPTTQETDSITVAVDAHEFDGSTVTATHSQSVTEDPALTLTGTFTSSATVGVAYQSDLLLGGGDGTYSLHGGTGLSSGSVPGGLALSIVTVSSLKYLRLSGNPTTAGTPAFTVSIDSGDGQNVTGAQSMNIISPVVLTGAFATPLYDGVPYSQSIAISGGTGPYSSPTVASGALPSGLALSIVGSTLVLSGTCSSGATSTFTVSCHDSLGTSATSASQSLTRQDQYFANVAALLHFDGANNSTTFADQIGHTWSAPGAGKLTTASKAYGTASLTAGSVTSAANSAYGFGSGDYTVEGWCTLSSAASAPSCLFDNRSASNAGIAIYNRQSTGATFLNAVNNSVLLGVSSNAWTVPQLGTWRHWAVSRVSGTLYLALGGTVTNIGADSRTLVSSPAPFIASNYLNGQNNDGLVDEVRITKGVGRYTANFTPPVDAFPNS